MEWYLYIGPIPRGRVMEPALHKALCRDDIEKVMELIQDDSQVIHTPDSCGLSALYYASQRGHVQVVSCLLHHGARVDQGDHLCKHDILDKACNFSLVYQRGWTSITAASYHGHTAVLQCLLDHPSARSIINHQDYYGKTALWLAYSEGYADVVRMLLEAGAWPNMTANDGTTPMAIARQHGHQSCMSLLQVSIYLSQYIAPHCHHQRRSSRSSSNSI